uniref:Uncharacterized protein n=1 Tax=Oryza brachyantha TaxID=4533 RepID=J3MDF1_ORYBR
MKHDIGTLLILAGNVIKNCKVKLIHIYLSIVNAKYPLLSFHRSFYPFYPGIHSLLAAL